MNSSKRTANRINQLTKKLNQLRHTAAGLEAANAAHHLAHNLVAGLCETASLLLKQRQAAGGDDQQQEQQCEAANSSAEGSQQWQHRRDALLQELQLNVLAAAECSLLEELGQHSGGSQQQLLQQQHGSSNSFSDASVPALPALGLSGSIAPASDQLALLKHLLILPVDVAATQRITELGMVGIHHRGIQKISTLLHKLPGSSTEQEASLLRDIRAESVKMMHTTVSLMLANREHVSEAQVVFNLDTLQLDVEGANAAAVELLPQIPARLGLTQQQQQDIVAGMHIFTPLLDGVIAERQQVQARIGSNSSSSATPQPPTPGAAAATASGSSSDAAASVPFLANGLEAEQDCTARLQLLIRKEYLLRIMGGAWFVGLLTWKQYALALVLCWPYAIRHVMMARAAQHWCLEQQQLGQQ